MLCSSAISRHLSSGPLSCCWCCESTLRRGLTIVTATDPADMTGSGTLQGRLLRRKPRSLLSSCVSGKYRASPPALSPQQVLPKCNQQLLNHRALSFSVAPNSGCMLDIAATVVVSSLQRRRAVSPLVAQQRRPHRGCASGSKTHCFACDILRLKAANPAAFSRTFYQHGF